MTMNSASKIVLAGLAAAVLTACEAAESSGSSDSPLEGAWSVVSISSAGQDVMVQPSVILFGDRHYSMMRVTGNQPRTLSATDSVTDAEKIAAYDTFVANSGTYEVMDSTITIHPTVARSPNFMAGGSDKYTYRVSGDSLWLSNTGSDIRSMIGGQLVGSRNPTASMMVLARQR